MRIWLDISDARCQTNAAAYSSPTFNSPSGSLQGWPSDSFQPSNPSPTSVRSDRPRLIAPAYKWQALPALIAQDPYLQSWNATIFGNASDYYSQPPVVYFMDGDSGILDNSRAVKERVKAFSYAYRMTNDTKWVDRTFTELQVSLSYGSHALANVDNTLYRMLPATDPRHSALRTTQNGTLPISSILRR